MPRFVFDSSFETPSITSLSQEFDEPDSIDRWRRIWLSERWGRDPLAQIDAGVTRPGWLTLVPHSSVWFEDHVGELLYRELDGDFVLSARVEARNRAGTGAPGSTNGGADHSEYSLVGLMLRAPRPEVEAGGPPSWIVGAERYVFLSFGSASINGAYQTEVKTTRAAAGGEASSVSVLQIDAVASDTIELRWARIGPHLIALTRLPAGAWQVHRRYLRADLPQRLQVGITCYTDWDVAGSYPYFQQNTTLIEHRWNDPLSPADPDLLAQVDYLRFAEVDLPEALQLAQLSDESQVSDEQLLEFLGFD